MKKLSLLFVFVLFAVTAALAQKPVITFAVKEYDFGKINEADGNATHVFEFVNKGNAPLVINGAKASCGCTTPTWSKEPVAPGKKGNITVVYAAPGRIGVFNKTITVNSNDTVSSAVLIIKGEVLKKQ